MKSRRWIILDVRLVPTQRAQVVASGGEGGGFEEVQGGSIAAASQSQGGEEGEAASR